MARYFKDGVHSIHGGGHNRNRFINVDDETIQVSSTGDLASRADFVDCRDGVFCIDNMRFDAYGIELMVCLWNPVLRQHNILPTTVNRSVLPIAIGFGFDVIGNDYKVLKVYSTKQGPSLHSNVDVYCVRTHCWKTIGSQPIANKHRP
ncbi:OLC1v1009254C1 [Oldenlandia corymbosa var. corymbosa]|uniref:OLC1v1009254C1 n=1 Tax=Oldenlandia corymbosa var. corymbosa TaxID=529605 RepID=A0AAV1DNG1_OLDCO|nr:OLC1v1009254C1 [Oldenlandia corymbosa var. corymbosa]